MIFTKQDSVTFAIGLAATVVLVFAQAMIKADMLEIVDNPWPVLAALSTNLLQSIGRYLITELTQRGIRRT